MKWVTNAPTETGEYLVSIKRQRPLSNQIFKYVAHYEAEKNKWYQYNPFDDDYKPTDEIEGNVTAWAEDMVIFMG